MRQALLYDANVCFFSPALFSSTSFLPAGSVQKTQDSEALQTGNV